MEDKAHIYSGVAPAVPLRGAAAIMMVGASREGVMTLGELPLRGADGL